MAPKEKIIRFGKRVDVSFAEGITWNEWIVHPNGGAQDEGSIREIIEADDQGREALMRVLYRRFTDQLMRTLSSLGAP